MYNTHMKKWYVLSILILFSVPLLSFFSKIKTPHNNNRQVKTKTATISENHTEGIKNDKRLLKKYSKVNFLSETFTPPTTLINERWILNDKNKEHYFHEKALPYLESMLKKAYGENMDMRVVSAYRSYNKQREVKDVWIKIYGKEKADTFSADPGFSEHQLGTTVDLTDPETIRLCQDFLCPHFAKSRTYQWLLKNAHHYGFTLSYPENNGFYTYEPWHWRFVGIDLAKYLKQENKYLHNLSQEKINEFLPDIFKK